MKTLIYVALLELCASQAQAAEAELAGLTIPEGQVVPSFAVVGLWITAIVAILGSVGLRVYREHARFELLTSIVERGGEVPEELRSNRAPYSDLRRGLIFVLGGIGTIITLSVLQMAPEGAWSVGVVPLLVGLAHLLFWIYEQSQR